MYVLPSDGVDQKLDTNGVIANGADAMERWFVSQTGGTRLRFDTFSAGLDISFFRLSRTDETIANYGAYVRDQIEAELKAAGFNHPKKIYAVYYGGSSTYSCGGGAWPPGLRGNVAAIYLNGKPPGAIPCSQNHFVAAGSTPGYWEFSMLHEILHTLGFVALCAPHETRSGHVSDDPRDLMYAGDQPWHPSILDIGHDDYYRHNNPACLDLAKSAFLDPTPADSQLPPRWTR